MNVAHVVPPQWRKVFSLGDYRIAFVPWVLDGWRFESEGFTILDHGLFESDLSIPSTPDILRAIAMVQPDEVVLPDVLGDSQGTLEAAIEILLYLPHLTKVMFVPQAESLSEWKECLAQFLNGSGVKPTIGLSSLRQPGSLKAQIGSRVPMMEYLHASSFQMHMLGLCSVRCFVEEELPAALKYGVRGIDTCAAFALGARNMSLTPRSPRLFLGSRNYKGLDATQRDLIRFNIETLNKWVKGDLS